MPVIEGFVLFVLLSTPTVGAENTQAPEIAARVTEFYRRHVPETHSGLLNAGELNRIQPFLSLRLYQQYARAIRAREAWAKANPDDPPRRIFNKPPCVEGGNYFESLAEWPDVRANTSESASERFSVGRIEHRRGRGWYVRMNFWFETTPKVEWTDTIIVVLEKRRFVIDDVIYSGGTFNRSGRLSELLDECTKHSRVDIAKP